MDKISLLIEIMESAEEYVLKNESPYFIMPDYEYFREVVTLFAKQQNLVESTLLLLDNNHNEEAMVLARSVLNNYFLIGYLLNDPDKSHIKEYQLQTFISELYYNKKLKTILNGAFGTYLKDSGKTLAFTENDIDRKIAFLEQEIINAGFSKDTRPLKIIDLAKSADERGFELYVAFYTTASKFEHSDISTLDIYKQKILDDVSNNEVFQLDKNRTDEKLKEKVLSIIITAYSQSLFKIIEEITINQPHLKNSYDVSELLRIGEELLYFNNLDA